MADDRDGYEAYYAEKLWAMLPALYRAEDTEVFGANGPLRELVNRIGGQAAVVRRGIDRLWEDQGIETCDDWVIAYLGDLLATNLVASLDARGQRVDVARTIYYRRRKGTLGVLEEIAGDITGWDARAVEFFRRLGRTRHLLDPEIGRPADSPDPAGFERLQHAQGLTGLRTHTPLGGLADLRSVYGATRTATPFDEFSHTADLRRGRGRVGWQNVPRLGFFLWRLYSFGTDETTPVRSQDCPNQYTFDPTGRDVPLFAAGEHLFGGAWVSPAEWQLRGPIDRLLLDVELRNLYAGPDPQDPMAVLPRSLGVYRRAGSFYDLVPAGQVTARATATGPDRVIDPERGRLIVRNPDAAEAAALLYHMRYHYGFGSLLGAGNYDRALGGTRLPAPPPERAVEGGGGGLDAQLAAFAPSGALTTGTLEIRDSLTYDRVRDLAAIGEITLRAENGRRPLVRLAPGTAWVFTGTTADPPVSRLVLDGLFLSGGDLVLRGDFASVTLSCCTLDPGSLAADGSAFATAIDGQVLSPSRLRVEGQIGRLEIDRCIMGPLDTTVAAGPDGQIERTLLRDTIVQALRGDRALTLDSGELEMERCTVMGPAALHRLHASECILDGLFQVADQQHGCVRFSAWTAGSELPRQYESVALPPQPALFTSRTFGDPGYAQLLQSVAAAITEGAESGSEMGAFSRERYAIKERSLRIKLEEFMPLGQVPVIVMVT